MKRTVTNIFGLTVFVMIHVWEVEAVDYCTSNNFNNSHGTKFMRFTKETVGKEFAVEGQFKALHCCAKGYRSIEW